MEKKNETGRDAKQNILERKIHGKPKHFKSRYTKSGGESAKGCFGPKRKRVGLQLI